MTPRHLAHVLKSPLFITACKRALYGNFIQALTFQNFFETALYVCIYIVTTALTFQNFCEAYIRTMVRCGSRAHGVYGELQSQHFFFNELAFFQNNGRLYHGRSRVRGTRGV